jgi:hypothetical protein
MFSRVFGTSGMDAYCKLVAEIRRLYNNIDLNSVSGDILIFVSIAPVNDSESKARESIRFEDLTNQKIPNIVLEISGNCIYRRNDLSPSQVEQISVNAVVYKYSNKKEEFWGKRECKAPTQLDSVASSQFNIPTFESIDDALQNYSIDNIKESTCYLFREVWHDSKRIHFKNKPESKMRDSLVNFLRARMGSDYDIRPEINVDESHPVDILIQSTLDPKKLVLIEIKWLGKSVDQSGHKISTEYAEARAHSGIEQLAAYLVKQQQTSPRSILRGYCVIIDGRRRNASKIDGEISLVDGMYYENQEIKAKISVPNLMPPQRMFAVPICAPVRI